MAKATKVNEVVLLTPTKLGQVKEQKPVNGNKPKRKFSATLMQNEHHIAQFFCDTKAEAEALIGQQCAVIAVERTDKDEKPFLRFEYYSPWESYVRDQKASVGATEAVLTQRLLTDMQLELVRESATANINKAALAAANI